MCIGYTFLKKGNVKTLPIINTPNFSTLRHCLWPDVAHFYIVACYRPHLVIKEDALHRLA